MEAENKMNKDKLEITEHFGQDFKRAKAHKKEITELLKPLKEIGLIDFSVGVRRICDFCGKTLKKGDVFITIGDDDKCEECIKNGSRKQNIKSKS